MDEHEHSESPADDVSEIGTGRAEDDDGNEPSTQPEPGVVGGGDQGAHPGSLGGVPAPGFPSSAQGRALMSTDTPVQPNEEGEDGEDGDHFYSGIGRADLARPIIGGLLAGAAIVVILLLLARRER